MDYNAGDFAISLRLILRSRVERAGEEYCEEMCGNNEKIFFPVDYYEYEGTLKILLNNFLEISTSFLQIDV